MDRLAARHFLEAWQWVLCVCVACGTLSRTTLGEEAFPRAGEYDYRVVVLMEDVEAENQRYRAYVADLWKHQDFAGMEAEYESLKRARPTLGFQDYTFWFFRSLADTHELRIAETDAERACEWRKAFPNSVPAKIADFRCSIVVTLRRFADEKEHTKASVQLFEHEMAGHVSRFEKLRGEAPEVALYAFAFDLAAVLSWPMVDVIEMMSEGQKLDPDSTILAPQVASLLLRRKTEHPREAAETVRQLAKSVGGEEGEQFYGLVCYFCLVFVDRENDDGAFTGLDWQRACHGLRGFLDRRLTEEMAHNCLHLTTRTDDSSFAAYLEDRLCTLRGEPKEQFYSKFKPFAELAASPVTRSHWLRGIRLPRHRSRAIHWLPGYHAIAFGSVSPVRYSYFVNPKTLTFAYGIEHEQASTVPLFAASANGQVFIYKAEPAESNPAAPVEDQAGEVAEAKPKRLPPPRLRAVWMDDASDVDLREFPLYEKTAAFSPDAQRLMVLDEDYQLHLGTLQTRPWRESDDFLDQWRRPGGEIDLGVIAWERLQNNPQENRLSAEEDTEELSEPEFTESEVRRCYTFAPLPVATQHPEILERRRAELAALIPPDQTNDPTLPTLPPPQADHPLAFPHPGAFNLEGSRYVYRDVEDWLQVLDANEGKLVTPQPGWRTQSLLAMNTLATVAASSRAASDDLELWSIADWKPLGKLSEFAGWEADPRRSTPSPPNAVPPAGVENQPRWTSLAFSAQGELLACGRDDGTLDLYNVRERKRVWRERAHASAVRALVFSAPEGELVTLGDDGYLRVWSTSELPPPQPSWKLPASNQAHEHD